MSNVIDDLMLDVRNRVSGNILDLVNKLEPNGDIIKISRKRSNEIEIIEQFNSTLDCDDYKQFSQQIQSLNLKGMIRNLNVSPVNHKISVFSFGNELFIHSILISTVMFIKPIFQLNPSLLNNQKEYNVQILIYIKQYILYNLESIKEKAIEKFLQNKLQSKHISLLNEFFNKKNKKNILSEKINCNFQANISVILEERDLDYLNKNIFLLDETLIQNLILWLNINIDHMNGGIDNLINKKPTNKEITQIVDNIHKDLNNFFNPSASTDSSNFFDNIFKNIGM